MEAQMTITGTTSVYGIIGDPVEHSFSPVIHNTISKAAGGGFVYVPFHVKRGEEERAVKGAYSLGVKGLNVTVPHKAAVMPYLYSIEKRAEAIGAVNTLKYTDNGYIGYNTDILGILYSLEKRGVYIKGKETLIIGAGGSARAALTLAVSEGAKKVIIANRTTANAEKLKKRVLEFYNADISVCGLEDIKNIERADIVIQTTTLGFGENEGLSPIYDKSFFTDKKVSAVFDTIYIPSKTKFLEDAQSLGITAVNGFDMLIYQAAAASEIWLDKKYDEEFIASLKRCLTLQKPV